MDVLDLLLGDISKKMHPAHIYNIFFDILSPGYLCTRDYPSIKVQTFTNVTRNLSLFLFVLSSSCAAYAIQANQISLESTNFFVLHVCTLVYFFLLLFIQVIGYARKCASWKFKKFLCSKIIFF